MNALRPLLGLAALALPPTALAQSTGQSTSPRSGLSTSLQSVYQQARPAVLRIEDCPTTACQDPDGVGTAFVISRDGLALTAYHVMFDSKNPTAVTLNHKRYPVSVVGYDDQSDLALIRVKFPGPVTPLNVAAAAPRIGDDALAIGNGGGAFLRPKSGKLLKLDVASDRADFASGTLQLSAQLIPGDSGGPILNVRGEVEGVVSYITPDDTGSKILSYAIPVTSTSALLADLKSGVKRDAPVVGLTFSYDLKPEFFPKVGLGPKPGAVPVSVTKGSPADKAGLRPLELVKEPATAADFPTFKGDVITAVNGKSVQDFTSFLNAVRGYKVGDTVTLSVQRGSQNLQLKLILASRAQIFGAQAPK